MSNICKALWTVEAGVMPGVPQRDLTRRWSFNDGDSPSKYAELNDQANGHARELMSNPARVNWVTLSFVWM